MTVPEFNLHYLGKLVRYAAKAHPLFVGNLLVGLAAVIVELAAVGSLFPLTMLAAGNRLEESSPWVTAVRFFGFKPDLNGFLVLFAAMMAMRALGQFFNQGLASRLGKKIQAELSARAFATIVGRFSLREIEEKTIGHFIALAGDETSRTGTILTTLLQFSSSVFLCLLYFASIVYLSPLAGLAVVCFMIVTSLGMSRAFARSHRLGDLQLTQAKSAHSVFLDSLNGLRSVRSFAAEDYVTTQYSRIIHAYTRTLFKLDLLNLVSRLIPGLILLAALGVIVGSGFYRPENPAELAFAVTVLAFLVRFFPAAGNALNVALRLTADLRAAKDVTAILEPPEAEGGVQPGLPTMRAPIEQIELRHVAFGYRPQRLVLNDVDLVLRRGASYALIGASGSGKSTLLDLMLKFYRPLQGDILIDGIGLRSIADQELRRRIVLLGQQSTIFNDTVANNIRFGMEADLPAVARACRLACLDEVIDSLPNGLDTHLQYQGSNLSGGQRQRVGIARALLRDADVLLLDESTSALDKATRERVVSNILSLYRDRLVLFSTHDEQIIGRVDRVIDVGNWCSPSVEEDEEQRPPRPEDPIPLFHASSGQA